MTSLKSGASKLLSIGDLARQTDMTPDGLRMWERRYGAPKSIRLPSGHRRYTHEEADRLQLVVQVLARGYRPHEVVALPAEELARRLDETSPKGGQAATRSSARLDPPLESLLRTWIDAALRFDEMYLARALHEEWSKLGPMRFLEDRAGPFLDLLGRLWAQDALSVAVEHFASAQVGDFLAAQWRRANERAPRSSLLMMKLPGDLHELGLLMAAVAATAADHRVVYLGSNTPPSEALRAAHELRPTAVCISVSAGQGGEWTRRSLRDLRRDLPEGIPIIIGGAGVPPQLPDEVLHVDSLSGFVDWLHRHDAENPR